MARSGPASRDSGAWASPGTRCGPPRIPRSSGFEVVVGLKSVPWCPSTSGNRTSSWAISLRLLKDRSSSSKQTRRPPTGASHERPALCTPELEEFRHEPLRTKPTPARPFPSTPSQRRRQCPPLSKAYRVEPLNRLSHQRRYLTGPSQRPWQGRETGHGREDACST